MGDKKRDSELAFVGRYRQARRDHYQKALLARLSEKLKDGVPRTPSAPSTPSTAPAPRGAASSDSQESGPPAAPWKRRERTLRRTIPLQPTGSAPRPSLPGDEASARRPETSRDEGSDDTDEPSPSSNWLGLEFAEAPVPADAEPTEAAADADAPRSPLEHLDSVVHDFVAAMDERTPAPSGDGVSPHAASFRRLLESSATPTGQILGPPVLFGASPPVGLESVLGLLGSSRETGVLHVEAGGTTFTISIVKGDVVHGVSRPRPKSELLGNVLVSLGMIDEDELDRFFEEHGASPTMLGKALDSEALVSTDELGQALEHQLRLLFDRLLATRHAVWCFRAGEATLAYINMRLNVIGVLLESARKNDERSAA